MEWEWELDNNCDWLWETFRMLESENIRRVLYERGGQRELEMVDGLSLMFSSWASVVKGQCVSRHASGSPRTPWRPSSLTLLLCFYPLIHKASCFSLFIYLSFPQSSSQHIPPNLPQMFCLFLSLFNSVVTSEACQELDPLLEIKRAKTTPGFYCYLVNILMIIFYFL